MHRLCPRPQVIITALLSSYFTQARQRNIVVSAQGPTYSPHVLRWSDLTATDNEVLVAIRSTKTRCSSVPPVIFSLPYIPGSPCCPETAWKLYTQTVPHLAANSPAFVLPNGSWLTVKVLSRALRIVAFVGLG